jgi:hypothetical protein
MAKRHAIHTIKRVKEILTEKLDNVRNWRTHSAKMKNAFANSTAAGIIIDEYRRVEAVRESIIGHCQMVTILKDFDHDYSDLHTHTFVHLTAYLELHLPNVVSHDDATKAHGLFTQINSKPGDDILLNMNAAQVTAYLALQDEVKKLRKNRANRNKKSKRSNRKSEDDTASEDESERPKKKCTQRPEISLITVPRKSTVPWHPDQYCWCHGTQKIHSSPECKVMAAETDEFTPAMRKSTKSTSPPGGSTNMYGRKIEVQGRCLLQKHLPPPPIVNSILRHKRQDKSDNNGKVYAIHDDLSTTDDNNYYIPGPAIAQASENDFSNDPNNEHTISCDIADGDIDSLEKLRNKHHNSDTRGDCLDDFITYHIAHQ